MELKHGPFMAHPMPARLDPGYDQPGPIRRGEISWRMVVEAAVVVAAAILFIGLVIARFR